MANEADKQADDFFRKLCAGGFRDDKRSIEGSHRNPRWKKKKKVEAKAEKKVYGD
jgi:hypothetical protein